MKNLILSFGVTVVLAGVSAKICAQPQNFPPCKEGYTMVTEANGSTYCVPSNPPSEEKSDAQQTRDDSRK